MCDTSRILHEKEIKLELSGDEAYYTNSLILQVKNRLCSKLHRQKFELNSLFIQDLEPYRFGRITFFTARSNNVNALTKLRVGEVDESI